MFDMNLLIINVQLTNESLRFVLNKGEKMAKRRKKAKKKTKKKKKAKKRRRKRQFSL